VVSQVKLIAEPWDVGEGGYQVGNFPPLWSEWNGKYRDTVRDYWRGQNATLGEFAYRLTGSADLYASTGRRPFASVNFITAHDGFTLKDLVSYNEKHNEENCAESLLNFTRKLMPLRRKHRICAGRKGFQGRPLHGTGVKDIAWFTPQAKEMSEEDWQAGFAKSLGVFLNGDAIASTDMYGDRVTDDSFYFVFNAHHEPMQFTLPD